VTSLAERADRAEETRDAVARARVTEERVRIARELHDVVAHHLAVINVHAGLAARSVRTAPDQAEGSLTHVQEAARTALDELGAVLRVLRADTADDGPDAEPPAPGLADLDALLRSFTAIGLAVRTSTTGRPLALDPACDLTAYRVVQEALTNAHKHGAGGTVLVRLDHGPDGLDLMVSNPATWPPTVPATGGPGTGNGLLGMRERVESIGGRLAAGADRDGTFRVTAHIPAAPTTGPGR
jgi:signal transduction histidine kinase